MEKIYKETFFLSAGETNAEQELSLPLMMAKIIDIATAHANELGIGNPAMADIKAGWVLSRVTIDMNRYPKVNDTYCISTWIESFNRHFSERAFCISSPDGEIFGYARTIWMVMSTVDHTNIGLSGLNLPQEMIAGDVPPIEKQAKHITILPPEELRDAPSNFLTATTPVFNYRFKYCDLDSYRHVNTVRYVTLLLNRFSLEEFDNTFVKRLELSFMHEAKYGMGTQLLRSDNESGLLSSFLLRKDSDHSPLFFGRILRQPR
ncbi:MAG: hypothetical protein K2H15_04190 [Muribaculaceae bacterium]|nr:hypothetical protein [Muribaculaceae bacterium]